MLGTDTAVGKSRVLATLAIGLRALGRSVWLHKPIACGGWSDQQAEDGRALAKLCADDQPADSVCPLQFPSECSPHLASAAAGRVVTLAELHANLTRCRGEHDLLIEGAGGLLAPLCSARETIADLLPTTRLPALIVTRPFLGTLNHTALTVAVARARGIPLLGLVVNWHDPRGPDQASRSAAHELAEITGVPVMAELPWSATVTAASAKALASACLAAHGAFNVSLNHQRAAAV